MAARWSPAPTMVSELPGHRQPIAKFRALTLAACPRARNPFLFLLSPIRAREAGAAALWLMAARWSPAPTMVSELPGHRQPIAKFRALTLAACPRATLALNDQRISSLTYTRARGGRRRALADGRTMVAGADDGERATGSSPTDRQIPRTDTGRLPRARNATALNDQRNRPVFISSLTYTRARGGRRRALADGRTMVAGADDGERATGSSPTDRQIPRTDTGRLPARAQRYGFERSAE